MRSFLASFVFFFLTAASAQAHPGHDLIGFSQGMIHPFLGLDHILVALMVGFWAVLQKERTGTRSWLFPLIFVLSLGLGSILSSLGFLMSFYEQGISLSLLFLGSTMILGLSWSERVSFLALFGMGFCHGMAHGLEMAHHDLTLATVGPCVGLCLSTGMIHVLGLLLLSQVRVLSKQPTWAQGVLVRTMGLSALIHLFFLG